MNKFIFEFALDNKCRKVEFNLNNNYTEDDWFDFLDNEYDNFIEPLEHKYGIHDGSGCENDDGSFEIGFTTYEVDVNKIDELMNIWEDKLKEIKAI